LRTVWYVPGMFLEQPSLRFRSFLTLVQDLRSKRIIYSYRLKLFPSVFQQDFLTNLFSCITIPSFLIQLLLKVLQPVVIRCLVAPSKSRPLHRVMENAILLVAVVCFVKLSGGFLCFCDKKGISNLAIVLVYQPDLCLEKLRKTTTPAVTFGHQSYTISKY